MVKADVAITDFQANDSWVLPRSVAVSKCFQVYR